MKDFMEDIDQLLDVICMISDYHIEFTNNNLTDNEKLRAIQLDFMLPMFKSYRTDSEKYHKEGKLKKLQSIYKSLEQECAENILLEEYVFNKTGIKLGMQERYYKRLEKILNRNKLKNDQEYYMIMDQINILCQLKKRDDALIDRLNKLVSDFEKKHAMKNK